VNVFFLGVFTQESLDEVTIKDTLEGDNMYTCSQCGKKVRAEKRSGQLSLVILTQNNNNK